MSLIRINPEASYNKACMRTKDKLPSRNDYNIESESPYQLAHKFHKEGKYADAFEQFLIAAEQGNYFAPFYVGECYYCARGVKQDFASAVKWYALGASYGHLAANRNLACCYANGHGVQKSLGKAHEYYLVAARGGDPDAQYHVGYAYYDGKIVRQDYALALQWFEKSAAYEGAELRTYSLNMLGYMYICGLGVKKDVTRARQYFAVSAALGDDYAKNMLQKYK